MKTMKHLLLGMGLGAAVMTALWKNPKSRQAMNDAMQNAADKAEDLYSAGLWGMRMMFTTESPRECLEVAKVYLGQSDYQPNVLTRGLYYRGVE